MATHKLVSADDHMDLHVLPPGLFTQRLSSRWRSRAPRVETTDGASVWVADDKVIGSSGSQKGTGIIWAFEKAGLEDDGFRPADPQLRLSDMDLDGVYAQVIYGSPAGLPIAEPLLREACTQVYNDWAAEFNAVDPDRLCLLSYLPSHSPEAAAAEAERVARLGHRGAVLEVFEVGAALFEGDWERLWSIAAEASLPLSFHFGGGTSMIHARPGSWMMPAYVTTLPLQLDEGLAAMIFCGALERHPGLRMVIAECGLGWLPYFLWRMDLMFDTYNSKTRDYPLKTLPSELFAQQVFVTFQEDPVGVPLIPQIGVENVMWASDYPHPNSTFPDSTRATDELASASSPEIARRVTRDNAAALYGLRAALS